eukprot:scaffold38308_cov34-Attheya_sp.AAC.2
MDQVKGMVWVKWMKSGKLESGVENEKGRQLDVEKGCRERRRGGSKWKAEGCALSGRGVMFVVRSWRALARANSNSSQLEVPLRYRTFAVIKHDLASWNFEYVMHMEINEIIVRIVKPVEVCRKNGVPVGARRKRKKFTKWRKIAKTFGGDGGGTCPESLWMRILNAVPREEG